jgi:hypothetical protein
MQIMCREMAVASIFRNTGYSGLSDPAEEDRALS